ncbi:Bifunctional purine biosynthesis protein PurH, partial [Coemansia sp. RSA 2599]
AQAVLCRLRKTANIEDEVAGWTDPAAKPAGRRTSTDSRGSSSNESLRAVQAQGGDVANDNALKPDDDDDEVRLAGNALHVDSANVTIFNIFRFAQYRKQWLLVLLLQFGQQLSGINTVFYYSSSVLEKMFSSYISSVLTMMIGVLNVLATASGALIVDRFGRRPLLFSSMASMAVSVVLLGLGLGLKINSLAAVSLYLVVASFAPGYGPVPFLLGTELFDIRASAAGGSWALAANWIGTFIVATAFLPLQNLIGEWVFSIFVVALITCGITFYFYIPETKGRTIEEISQYFK